MKKSRITREKRMWEKDGAAAPDRMRNRPTFAAFPSMLPYIQNRFGLK